ncbi:MAG: YHYH domain-containing protein [Acidobacteriota bacterium]|nr:YHYH domain-containing protein [Acidobacteriota bacterium]
MTAPTRAHAPSTSIGRASLFLWAAAVAATAAAHPGGLDSNGGHVERTTGQYHCHRDDCVPPAAETGSGAEIAVASFNIQFLGNSRRRDNQALASMLGRFDIVVVQELVSPPFAGTFPNGKPFRPDAEAAAFFEAMQALGFDFVLSPEDTGTGDRIHRNGSATEWWVVFFDPETVRPDARLPQGFLAGDRSNHQSYERVPYAFAFSSERGALDFVLVSVHLQPGSGSRDAARRAEEIAAIVQWVDANDEHEQDFLILGDMNIEDCEELEAVMPSGYASLNDRCLPTNTNVNGPRPYDHVFYRTGDTSEAELPRAMEVVDLIDAMAASWPADSDDPYPGDPYHHNRFRAIYSDHHPITFVLVSGDADDD